MEQQQINKECQQHEERESSNEDILPEGDKYKAHCNLQTAIKAERHLLKNININFLAYQQYFNKKNVSLSLHKNKSSFNLISSIYDRQRLSLQRQSMYYRGAVDEFLDPELFQQILNQSKNQKGFVLKKGNKSVIIENILYYAHKNSIKAIKLPQFTQKNVLNIYQQSTRPIQIIQFQHGQQILEIKAHKIIKNSFSNKNQFNLLIRFSRKIAVFNLIENQILYIKQSSSQFISFNNFDFLKNCFQTIQYDGSKSYVKLHQMGKNNSQIQSKNEIDIKDLVVSSFYFSANQSLLTKYEGISILDNRLKKQIPINFFDRNKFGRFYSSIEMKGNFNYTPYFISCESRNIFIFDIRNPNNCLSKFYHNCQESPPQILQFYDGDINLNSSQTNQNIDAYPGLVDTILSCHSPNTLGSSIFTNINLKTFQFQSQQQNSKFSKTLHNIHFTLLCDKNKQGKQYAHIYNESLSFRNFSSQKFQIYKINNQGNIDVEFYQYNQFQQKYKRKIVNDSERFNKQEKSSPKIYSQEWLKQFKFNKYFTIKQNYQQIDHQANSQLTNKKQQKQKTKKKTKKKSQNKTKDKKSLKSSEQITQTQDINIQDCQFQNSDECQQFYSQRKLNYVQLSRFYLKLKQNAANSNFGIQFSNQFIEQQPKYSLNTQANTQNQSLSLFSESYNKQPKMNSYLNFYNKNVMSSSIVQKLLSEWEN